MKVHILKRSCVDKEDAKEYIRMYRENEETLKEVLTKLTDASKQKLYAFKWLSYLTSGSGLLSMSDEYLRMLSDILAYTYGHISEDRAKLEYGMESIEDVDEQILDDLWGGDIGHSATLSFALHLLANQNE